MADLSSVSTNFFATASETFSNNLSSSISAGATTVPVNNASAYTTGDIVVLTVEPGTSNEATFIGQKDTGNQFINCVWTEGNTGVGHSAGASVIDYTAATHQAALVKGIKKFANQDGTLISSAVQYALNMGAESLNGWNALGVNVSTVAANGNRSYTMTFASDVSSILSEGMKLRTTRTVAAPTYMGGAFNGSSHYFTKTSPSGTLGTVTNNFTIMGWVQLTAYGNGNLASRLDAVGSNGFKLRPNADGTVMLAVYNGGGSNFRAISTYQSLPLNKKTHVAATWASGTVTIYFDGVSVPVQTAITGGTAPTAAGTGGDFSIGRAGASNSEYLTGYSSGVGVFDAVLSATTIKNYGTYGLTGSETNCIGAWDLNNRATDQNSAGNNLTATGGVGYTQISPYGNGGVSSTLDYALAMAVSGSTVTVQVPEGCTIPTSGGVSAVAYSVMASPYGFVTDKGRWEVTTLHLAAVTQNSPASSTYYFGSSFNLTVPVGSFEINLQAACNWGRASAGELGGNAALSTSTSTATNKKLIAFGYTYAGDQVLHLPVNLSDGIRNITQTTYYAILNAYNGTHIVISFGSNFSSSSITATPSGL